MSINFINTYKNIFNPKVLGEIDVYTFMDSICNPSKDIKEKIEMARNYYSIGDKELYKSIKFSLPCYTLNFSFYNQKNNENIKGSTGFIYLDVDGNTEIDYSNELIFSSWKSISNYGRGILIKANGLNLENFNYNYKLLSELIGIDTDKNAAKPTQFNIQSYDTDIYINNKSIVWEAKSVTFSKINKVNKRLKDNTECYTFGTNEIRYNNIDDYDFGANDFIFFEEEKEEFCQVFIPKIIPEGKRNETLFACGCQFRGLNKNIDFSKLIEFLYKVNDRCSLPLEKTEIKKITKSIMAIENIEPKHITPRRILFSPKSKLTKSEKIKKSNQLNGARKSKITQGKIIEVINNWDKEKDGKMTNTSIAEKLGISRATVSRQITKLKKETNIQILKLSF